MRKTDPAGQEFTFEAQESMKKLDEIMMAAVEHPRTPGRRQEHAQEEAHAQEFGV